MIDTSVIRERFSAVGQDLNERSRRLLAAAEAKTAGHGGIRAASRATGVARSYPKGIKVTDAEMETLNIKGDIFYPEWNYTISPRPPI